MLNDLRDVYSDPDTMFVVSVISEAMQRGVRHFKLDGTPLGTPERDHRRARGGRRDLDGRGRIEGLPEALRVRSRKSLGRSFVSHWRRATCRRRSPLTIPLVC